MAKCAVIDLKTNAVMGYIIAEPTDPPYEGTKLVEISEECYWDETTGQVLNGN